MTIREAIIEALKKSGLSQSELARRTGLTQSRVNDYLRGRRDATTETVDKMLEVLGLAVSTARRPR